MKIISIPLNRENLKLAKSILRQLCSKNKRSNTNVSVRIKKNSSSGMRLDVYLGTGNIRLAQLGGMGLPAGDGGMTGLNVDIDSGFRMWPYSSQQEEMDQLEENVRKQFRYNPSYMTSSSDIEEARKPDKEKNILSKYIPNIKIEDIDIYLDEHRKPIIKIITNSGKVYREHANRLLGINDDLAYMLAKDKNRFQLKWRNTDDGVVILVKSIFMPGDKRGVTEVNKGPSVPGFAYIDEDGRASLSIHPELLDNREWTAGGWSPSKPSFLSGYPYHPY